MLGTGPAKRCSRAAEVWLPSSPSSPPARTFGVQTHVSLSITSAGQLPSSQWRRKAEGETAAAHSSTFLE